MGLEEKFRTYSVKEEGLRFVNSKGSQIAYFPANRSGQGIQNFTTDHEIMRGDLCQLLYDASKDRVNYIFRTSIQSINEDPKGLDILFSDGRTDGFDLVVGADGQRSRTRQLILRPDDPEPFHPLGMFAGYFIVPKKAEENELKIASSSPEDTIRKKFRHICFANMMLRACVLRQRVVKHKRLH